MKICVAGGTRPEWIKLAPIIWELQRKKANFFIMHTGQHYSKNLDGVFFEQLNLPKPRWNLEVGSSTHGRQTGEVIAKAEGIFEKEKPDIVIVEGDTNSVFGVAVAAQKMGIKIAHVEAGLRSRDKTMPEEVNRIMVDHISHYLFAPTERSRKNLLKEGIVENKIHITGNTIVDSIMKSKRKIKLHNKNSIVVTFHRQENVDNRTKMLSFIRTLMLLKAKYHNWDIIFVVHPRTIKKLNEFNMEIPEDIKVIESIGYFEFLSLVKSANIVLSDSGGLQEECCILGVPCVTLRDSTERPESIVVGANLLAGVDPDVVLDAVKEMLKRKNWKQPFGDGNAGKRIVKILMEER